MRSFHKSESEVIRNLCPPPNKKKEKSKLDSKRF